MKTILWCLAVFLWVTSARCELMSFAITDGTVVEDFWQVDADKQPAWPAGKVIVQCPNFAESGFAWSGSVWETKDGERLTHKHVADWLAKTAGTSIAETLKAKLSPEAWQEFRTDAAQSEFVLILLNVTLNLSEQVQLLTKALAASSLTNNLTAQERSRVSALKAQLTFPTQTDVTADDRSRAVYLRDSFMVPQIRLWTNAVRLINQAKAATQVFPEKTNEWPAVDPKN